MKNEKTRSIFWWIMAILFTITIAIYQRMTGPTHPVKGSVVLNESTIPFKLLRSHGGDGDAVISIPLDDATISGTCQYKRKGVDEPWHELSMTRSEGNLTATLPHQPPAGKLRYQITLQQHGTVVALTEEPVTIRFKGGVPAAILIPHILLMFMAMLFSTRTGIEALRKGDKTYRYTVTTLLLLIPGGLILGPVVQWYAFGDLWTGWPFGGDMTDNKTLVAVIFWIVALVMQRKQRSAKGWALAASVVLLIVYLVPHSMFGSEFDHNKGAVTTGRQTEQTR